MSVRTSLLTGAALAVTAPSIALAQPPTPQHASVYQHAYRAVVRKLGHRAPGRNIISYGFSPGRAASDSQVTWSLAILRRMLAPAPIAPVVVDRTVTTPSVGASSLPACASESGSNYSTGPANTNPSSGATGRFQVIQSTHAALCGDLGWTPAEQDACALRIYRAQGAGAWVGCSG